MTKIIFYRSKCIGCGLCFEQQPELWRMSTKDGKATLLRATAKKDLFVLPISQISYQQTEQLTKSCPVKIIKLS